MRQLEVHLTPRQRRRLRQLRDHAPSPRVAKRAMCLLRSAAGEPAATIARVTGLSRDAITDIRRRWRRRGLRSLRDRPRSGRPPRVTEAYRRELRRALRAGPLALGYVFTVWSIARLAAHLRRRTGVALGADWLRRLAHAEGFSVGRPKHTLAGKRDRRAYRAARRRLARLKKGRRQRARPMNCGTATPPPSNCCRTWCAAGTAAAASGP
jgi:transposase